MDTKQNKHSKWFQDLNTGASVYEHMGSEMWIGARIPKNPQNQKVWERDVFFFLLSHVY